VTAPRRYLVVVCRGPECGERRGSAGLHREFSHVARELGLEGQVQIGWQSCFGRCRQGPNVLVRPAPDPAASTPLLAAVPARASDGAALYNDVRAQDVKRILQSHVVRGIIVRDLVLRPEAAILVRSAPKPADKPKDPTGDPSGEA
jgi:(2Fe-2S) ferredoxin